MESMEVNLAKFISDLNGKFGQNLSISREILV